MPHIKFTDTNVGAIPTPDKTVWYTDPKQKGLRLCVTKTGVKTWYVNKWDPTANKVRSVKLAHVRHSGGDRVALQPESGR